MLSESVAVAAGFGGLILRTENGGTTWTTKTSGVNNDLRSVHFSGNTGIVVGIGGAISRSTDGGQAWSQINGGPSSDFYAVQFADANHVYMAGTGRVMVSADAGLTWTTSSSPSFGGDLYALSLKGGKGWTAGQNGLLLTLQP